MKPKHKSYFSFLSLKILKILTCLFRMIHWNKIDVIEEEIDSDVICEQKIESFKSLINNEFCNFVVANWEDKSVQKCFDALAGKVASSVKGGIEKFKWYCYGFGHELSAKQKSGKKKKNGK